MLINEMNKFDLELRLAIVKDEISKLLEGADTQEKRLQIMDKYFELEDYERYIYREMAKFK